MSENKDDFLKEHPGVKFNEFIEEQVPVRKLDYDHTKGTITSTYKLEKIKTKYIHAPYEKLRCPRGTHIFTSVDPKKNLFSCKNCAFYKKVSPAYFKFVDGQLISRTTNKPV